MQSKYFAFQFERGFNYIVCNVKNSFNFSYIKDIRREILESKSKEYNNMNHPINAFHVIRRFVTAWQEIFNQVGNFLPITMVSTDLFI